MPHRLAQVENRVTPCTILLSREGGMPVHEVRMVLFVFQIDVLSYWKIFDFPVNAEVLKSWWYIIDFPFMKLKQMQLMVPQYNTTYKNYKTN